MPSASTIWVFATATVVFLLIPGPAVMYIVTRSVAHGRRAGLASVLGIHTGTLIHVAGAVLGLSAVLATSATAFTVAKFAGAAYLVYLGIRALATRGDDAADDRGAVARSHRRLVAEGFVVNLLNPKAAVFFLAFVPQFVEPDAGSATVQLLVISAVYLALGLVCDTTWALTSGWFGARLAARRGAVMRRLRRGSGVVYIALGAATALTGRHASA